MLLSFTCKILSLLVLSTVSYSVQPQPHGHSTIIRRFGNKGTPAGYGHAQAYRGLTTFIEKGWRDEGSRIPPGSIRSGPEKRATSARFTRYKAGLGACGGYNSDNDFIVAMSAQDWDGGSHCYDAITITYHGKTAHAQIVDRCEECPHNALDLSLGLFSFFEDPGQGVFYGDWSYGSGSPPPPPPPPPSPTHSSSNSPPTPSTTSTSHVDSTTSTSLSATSSSTSRSSTLASATQSSAAPAATIAPDDPHFLNEINMVMLIFGDILITGSNIH